MRRFKFWSLAQRFWAIVGVVVVGGAIAVAVRVARNNSLLQAVKTTAPVVGALIALASLLVTITGLAANWRRQKREATLKAWAEWSDNSLPARRALLSSIGRQALTEDVGLALANGTPLPADCPVGLTEQNRSDVRKDMLKVLNGLERLAVGEMVGVYDAVTLRKLGGTIIVRAWQQAEPYVSARRNAKEKAEAQASAFITLESLSKLLETHKFRGDSRNLDSQRLYSLKKARRG